MKQPKIQITDIHGEDWGVKKVTHLGWNINGNLVEIKVDFMGNYYDLMVMYDIDCTGTFTNIHGNLKGKLIF
jgi:hypothetical protein